MSNDAASLLSKSEIPPSIIQWLAQFKNLQGIPFNYLVADERLLPTESIKFFEVDSTWMESLLDGALSIGRQYTASDATSPTLIPEQVHRINMGKHVHSTQANLRRMQFKGLPAKDSTSSVTITGFLLRSAVVSNWPGMEVAGYAKGSSPYDNEKRIITPDKIKPLDILRLENLSATVLIGLFSDSLYELVLHQPPEGIHFGFSKADTIKNTVTKSLRVPVPGWDTATSYNEKDSDFTDLTYSGVFTDNIHRVIDLQKMSQLMGQTFHAQSKAPGYLTQQQEMLSSDFAMEMVQGVGLVSFINDVS